MHLQLLWLHYYKNSPLNTFMSQFRTEMTEPILALFGTSSTDGAASFKVFARGWLATFEFCWLQGVMLRQLLPGGSDQL